MHYLTIACYGLASAACQPAPRHALGAEFVMVKNRYKKIVLPIVPAAVLFDLARENAGIRPSADTLNLARGYGNGKYERCAASGIA